MENIGCILMLLFFPIAIIITIIKIHDNSKRIKRNKVRQNEWMEQKRIKVSADYSWSDSASEISYRLIADDIAENVIIFDGVNCERVTKIPYSEIIGFEIRTDDQVSGGVGRAIVGGVLAGGVGAIVGASTGSKRKIASFKGVIYRNDMSNPNYAFDLIKSETDPSNVSYIQAREFAENVNSVIKVILSKNEMKKDQLHERRLMEETYKNHLINTKQLEGTLSRREMSIPVLPLPMESSMIKIVEDENMNHKTTKENSGVKFCYKCGKRINSGAKFCYSCGSKVASFDNA